MGSSSSNPPPENNTNNAQNNQLFNQQQNSNNINILNDPNIQKQLIGQYVKKGSKGNANKNKLNNNQAVDLFQPQQDSVVNTPRKNKPKKSAKPSPRKDFMKQKLLSYFENIPKTGQIPMLIYILQIVPSNKNGKFCLEKTQSQHGGRLLWSVQDQNWVFQLMEEGGYSSKFIVNQEGELISGYPELWEIICPICPKRNLCKVGQFNCSSNYIDLTSANAQAKVAPTIKSLNIVYDEDMFIRWQQKPPGSSFNSKPSSPQKQKKQQKLPQYRETNCYFTKDTNQWFAGVRIQEQKGEYEAWLIQHGLKVNENSIYDNMSKTLKNDIQIRQDMFLKSAKDKIKKDRKFFV